MKKVKEIVIKINVKHRRKGVKQALPPALFDRLERVLRRELRTTKDHFKRRGHGWDLSYRLLYGNILQDVFGSDLEWYVLGRFLKAGEWKWKKSRWGGEEDFLCKPKKRRKRTSQS